MDANATFDKRARTHAVFLRRVEMSRGQNAQSIVAASIGRTKGAYTNDARRNEYIEELESMNFNTESISSELRKHESHYPYIDHESTRSNQSAVSVMRQSLWASSVYRSNPNPGEGRWFISV